MTAKVKRKHPSGTLTFHTDSAHDRFFNALTNVERRGPFDCLMGDIERKHSPIAWQCLFGSLDAPDIIASGGSVFNGFAYQPGISREE